MILDRKFDFANMSRTSKSMWFHNSFNYIGLPINLESLAKTLNRNSKFQPSFNYRDTAFI